MKKRFFLLCFLIVGLFGCILSAFWMLYTIIVSPDSQRGWRVVIAYDQLANAMTGGSEDETISSRAGREKKNGTQWACVLCKFLNWLQKDHCENSIGT